MSQITDKQVKWLNEAKDYAQFRNWHIDFSELKLWLSYYEEGYSPPEAVCDYYY